LPHISSDAHAKKQGCQWGAKSDEQRKNGRCDLACGKHNHNLDDPSREGGERSTETNSQAQPQEGKELQPMGHGKGQYIELDITCQRGQRELHLCRATYHTNDQATQTVGRQRHKSSSHFISDSKRSLASTIKEHPNETAWGLGLESSLGLGLGVRVLINHVRLGELAVLR
jgi:hypothetical protein